MKMSGGKDLLDKNIPHIGVLMTKDNPSGYPKFILPDGYSFCTYQKGIENDWAKLQVMLEQIDSIDEAKKCFELEYLDFPSELTQKCIFVKDSHEDIIATASIWRGNHFGEVLQRIHWVAVHSNHQGKGIAKALITKVLDIYNALGYKDFVYLASQTWSYKAISIYLNFGFKPFLGDKPINWSGTAEEFDNDKTAAWMLIEVLKELTSFNLCEN